MKNLDTFHDRAISRPELGSLKYIVGKPVKTAYFELRQALGVRAEKRKLKDQIKKNSSNRNAIFVWIPKSAGTSMMTALSDLGGLKIKTLDGVKHLSPRCGIVSFGHMSLDQLLKRGHVDSDYANSAFKFAIVRNPFCRAVSLFEYLKKIRVINDKLSFSNFCRVLDDRTFEPVGLYNQKNLSQVNQQTCWTHSSEGVQIVDWYGKLESLDDSLKILQEELMVPLPTIPSLNTGRRTKPTKQYYTEADADIVRSVYADDFRVFDYSLDLP